MNINEDSPRYVISIASEMLGLKTYTLRYYERIGIIKPRRSSGNIRLYSESDINLLRKVRTLIDELGVNMAGVEVILNMLQRMQALQKDRDRLAREVTRLKEKLDESG
jgi:MerR family transcriptional regulator/heat shock protein HspR